MWEYRATPLRVIDGDTLRLLVDLGFHARHQVDLRLLDVWAPELDQPGGQEARTFVVDWIERSRSGPVDWPLQVRTEINKATEPTQVRTFTRYVGDVWDSTRHLNEDLRRYLQA